MQRPLLYTYRRCPYAMRARMALLQAGIGFDAHEIVLRDKPAELLRCSPKATVPVLVLPAGGVVDQSLDIMRWAFGQGAAHWWERAQAPALQSLVACNDGPFKQHLDHYKYPERQAAAGPPDQHRVRALECLLEPLERQLADHAFLAGPTPCAADLAIFPFVRQFRGVDEAWFDAQPLPATQRWLQGWLGSALFQRCMRKLAVGLTASF